MADKCTGAEQLMADRNPFVDTKLEYEPDPVLWFSARSKRISQRGKSTFINGTRGSGKTSILRSLSTRDIAEIPSLNEQLREQQLDWVGVYFRFQDTFADILTRRGGPRHDTTHRTAREDKRFVVFCQYIELMLLAALSDDLAKLRASGFLKFSAGSEYDAIQQLFGEVHALRAYASNRVVETFMELSRVCRRTLQNLFSAALSYDGRIPTDIFKTTVPGAIVSSMGRCIVPIVRGDRFRHSKKLTLKLLLDDCESLPSEHQIYLNTLIRNSASPISWVIAYVGGLYDARTTIRDKQMLSDADREMEALDETREIEFRQLCARVASLRLYEALDEKFRARLAPNGRYECFDLETRLGRYTLNALIESTFEASLSDKIQDWRLRATEWAKLLQNFDLTKAERDELEVRDNPLPYTVAVAARYLDIAPADAERALSDVRAGSALKKRLARKQRAAFLVLGRELGTRMKLAGARMVIALSDGCIRDFLDIMRQLYDRTVSHHTPFSVFKFVTDQTPISMSTQSAAIYAASENKVKGVATIADPYGAGVTRLVEALGKLTAELQSNPASGAIRHPEVGLFRIHWPRIRSMLNQLGRRGEEIDELFRKSELDGFVREVDIRDRIISRLDLRVAEFRRFRLHRRFAPTFGFSFRGPYAEYHLSESAFIEVLMADSKFAVSDWVKRTLRGGNDGIEFFVQPLIPGLDEDLDD